MSAFPAVLAVLVGAALIAAPWWSVTLPASDYRLIFLRETLGRRRREGAARPNDGAD